MLPATSHQDHTPLFLFAAQSAPGLSTHVAHVSGQVSVSMQAALKQDSISAAGSDLHPVLSTLHVRMLSLHSHAKTSSATAAYCLHMLSPLVPCMTVHGPAPASRWSGMRHVPDTKHCHGRGPHQVLGKHARCAGAKQSILASCSC